MFLTLLSLIAIFLFDRTLGKAIDPQRNNEDFIRRHSRGMQHAKEMLWRDQANFYRNPLKSATSDGFAFEQSSVPIPNDVPASIIKQLSVPTKSLTTTRRNLFLLRNEDNSEIMTLCLLHPAKSAANYATSRNLLLLYI